MHQRHKKLFARPSPVKKRPKTPYEATDQAMLCCWMDLKRILYFAIPNDGKRSPAMAQKAAATGLKRGVPDLCIPQPRAPYHGLYIELKRRVGGTVSVEQAWWRDVLRSQGYRAEICHGYDAAVRVLEDYFKGI